MSGKTRAQIIADLEEVDPDYLVDVLGITASELLDAFPVHVRRYVDGELGCMWEEPEDEYESCSDY